ncbi:MAG: hypothetical protein O9282_02660 [Flavobacterium sp.]|jgi:hypothetical protein|uniref:hypothetical protein n=1 Tax=Flavobacterium sp. TaxID=239 RepID=UPI0022C1F7AB|nr:hypothetical protein [Flavobacterium sp.]MCZ8023745.1 hypothetical protein [Cytophagales bacterium]MCZ8330195.1 hypothetical protein [Flavobacterium sp.]
MDKPNLLIFSNLSASESIKYYRELTFAGQHYLKDLKDFKNSHLISIEDVVGQIILELMTGELVVNLDFGNPVLFLTKVVLKKKIINQMKSKKIAGREDYLEESANLDDFETEQNTNFRPINYGIDTKGEKDIENKDEIDIKFKIARSHFREDKVVLTLIEAWIEKKFAYNERSEICNYYELTFREYDSAKLRLVRFVGNLNKNRKI